MSWAVPVVVSNIEGHRDLVSPGSTGMVFPVGDATALANALLLTLSGSRAAGERAGRALREVREHYSATAMARRHIETYCTLIGIQR
jgi:glycosyltransferase involved in cell wall biosynthesis